IRGSQCCQVRGVLGPAVGDEGLTEAADRGHEHEHDGAEPDDDVRHDGSPLSPSYLAVAEASTVSRKKIAAGRLMVTVTTEYPPSARTDTVDDVPACFLASATTAAWGSPRAISRAADRAASKARSWEKPTAAAPVSRTTRTTMAGMTTANSAVAVPESCSWSDNRLRERPRSISVQLPIPSAVWMTPVTSSLIGSDLRITTSRAANPQAASVVIAYSAVVAPVSAPQNSSAASWSATGSIGS